MSTPQDIKVTERASAWWASAKSNRLFPLGLALAAAVALIDQFTKYLIVHVVELPRQIRPCVLSPEDMCRQIEVSRIFNLTYVENIGASFGMLGGMRWPLAALSFGVAIALAYWLGRLRRPIPAAGVGLIIGGALGNLYDRLAYGYVVDFLDFSGLMFPWVFNVADAGINVGVALLLLDAWLTRDRPEGG